MYEYRFKLIKIINPAVIDVNIDLGFNVFAKRRVIIKNYTPYCENEYPKLLELETTYLKEIFDENDENRLISFSRDIYSRREVVIFLSDGAILNDKMIKYHNLIKNYR